MELIITKEIIDKIREYKNTELIKSMLDFGLGFTSMTLILQILENGLNNFDEIEKI